MFPRVMGQFLSERGRTGFEIAKDDCIKGAVVFFLMECAVFSKVDSLKVLKCDFFKKRLDK
jgi:hypothetical protein